MSPSVSTLEPTPTGPVVAPTPLERRAKGQLAFRGTTYRVRFPAPAPEDLRVTLVFGREGEAVWATIPELSVSSEGSDMREAFRNVLTAARDWLSYVREEEPDLADELRDQARYVALLDAPEFSWFKKTSFDD